MTPTRESPTADCRDLSRGARDIISHPTTYFLRLTLGSLVARFTMRDRANFFSSLLIPAAIDGGAHYRGVGKGL